MMCFGAKLSEEGCGKATHLWLEGPVRTVLCDMHAKRATERGWTVRKLKGAA